MNVGQLAALACLWEVSASKPGNVHRAADFEDLSFVDFAAGAVAIIPAMDAAAAGGRLGQTVLGAVQATREAVATNTNLGTVLLMAPLAMASRGDLRKGVASVLRALDADDARLVYEAIRLAHPGGMGRVAEADIAAAPPEDLIQAMRLAADRDLVARQYVNDFAEVFDAALPALADGRARGWRLASTIVHAQMQLMSSYPDSLIARKCGIAVAAKSAAMASAVLNAGQPGDTAYQDALADLDFWLRSDGHRRNPGTTADLLAAGLFAAVLDGTIKLPVRFY